MSKKKRKKLAEGVKETTREVSEQVGKEAKSFRSDFKKFIAKGNIIDLAVAVVIGTAFNNIVTALVNNIITPLTGRALISANISDLKWVLVEGVEADPENGIEAVSEVAVTYGVFLQAVIDFLMVAMSIFIVLRVIMKIKDAIHRKEREAAEKRAAEEKARKEAEAAAEAERKRIEAEEEAARMEKIKNDFLNDVSVQADVLEDIKRIMLRMERRMRIAEEKEAQNDDK